MSFLRLFEGIEVLLIVIIPALIILVLLALPWLERSEDRHWKSRKVVVISVTALFALMYAAVPYSKVYPPPTSTESELLAVTQKDLPLPSTGDQELVLRGRRVFQMMKCVSCHELGGIGDPIGPSLDGIGSMYTPRQIRAQILHSKKFSPRSTMPSFAEKITEEDLQALVEYISNLKTTAPVFDQADDPLNSSKVLKLTTFATYSPSPSPESAIDLTHPKDGSGRIFVSTNQGKIHAFSSSGTSLGTFLDFNTAGVPDFDGSLGFTTRGLSYIAFHPDYGTAGAPGEGKLYTIYKTNIPGVRSPDYSGAELPTRPGNVLTQYAIVEWTVDAKNPSRIDTTSRREVIRFEVSGSDKDTHSVGEISFNPLAMPGQADYGNLYLSLGDSYAGPARKNFQHTQDSDNPFGKVLRINPLQNGSDPYSVPADNPFHDGGSLLDNDNNVEEIAAWGFRYPQNFSFAKGTGGNHRMIVFDIGAGDFEEVNIVDLGDNHGWSRHDGPVDGNMKTVLKLPPGSTLEFPATGYDHNIPNLPGATPTKGPSAITGGFVVSDPGDPSFQNQVVFSDLARGAFFHVDFDDLLAADAANTQASMSVMAVSLDGSPAGLFRDLIGQSRGDARFGVDERGRLFIISRLTNEIYLTDLIADQTAGDINGRMRVKTSHAVE